MTKEPTITKLVDSLHEQFLLTQRKMRWLRLNTPHKIDPTASNVLPIIGARESLSPSKLSQFLLMHPSGVSRMLKHLESAGYISKRTSATDGRGRMIELTAAGHGALRESIALDRHLATTGLAPLTTTEITRLTALFRQLADSFGAEQEAPLPNELPFVTEQKRLARIKGMIGSSYLGTAYDITEYQVLFELWRTKIPKRFKDLASVLPLDPTVLARRLERYTAQGIVKKSAVAGDRRGTSYILSTKARAVFEAEDQHARGRVATALSSWHRSDLHELLQLLTRVSSAHAVPPRANETDITWCRSAAEWYRARAFVIEQLVVRGEHLQLPSNLLSEEGIAALSTRDHEVIGVAYLSSSHNLEYLEWRGPIDDVTTLLEELRRKATNIADISTIRPSKSVIKRWGNALLKAGLIHKAPH